MRYARFEQDSQIKGRKGQHWTASYIGFVLAKGRPVRRSTWARPRRSTRPWRPGGGRSRSGKRVLPPTPSAAWSGSRWRGSFPPETTTVVLALDGQLTAVPWGALPGDRPGTVLLEQYTLATVPHAPFLLDRLTAPPPSTDDRGILLAVGGVAYDQAPEPAEDETTRSSCWPRAQPETARGRGDGWKEPPGTLAELDAVTMLAGPRPVIRLEGSRAPAPARLLRDLPRARWAHIATHGFFADPRVPLGAAARSQALRSGRPRERVGAGLRNPLVLSGLVLAGANRPRAEVDRLAMTTWAS